MTAKPTRTAKHIQRTERPRPQQDIHNDTAQEVLSIGRIVEMLVQFGLPHSDPGEIASYTAENGDRSITVRSVVEDGGVPWGDVPRLLLAYVGSRAVSAKSPVVHLDHSLGDFFRFLRDQPGMDVTGGQSEMAASVREQAYRLFTSAIVVTQRQSETRGGRRGTRTTVRTLHIARSLAVGEPRSASTPDELWRFKIILTDEFYKFLGDTLREPLPGAGVDGIRNHLSMFDMVPAEKQTDGGAYPGS